MVIYEKQNVDALKMETALCRGSAHLGPLSFSQSA